MNGYAPICVIAFSSYSLQSKLVESLANFVLLLVVIILQSLGLSCFIARELIPCLCCKHMVLQIIILGIF